MPIDLPGLIGATLRSGGDADALAFDGRWRSWTWIGAVAAAVDGAVAGAATVGLVARNRPHHIATYAANLAARRTTAMLYSAQSARGLSADIERLALPAIVADRQDWSEEALAAARAVGSIAVATEEGEGGPLVTVLATAGAAAAANAGDAAIALQLLSSGTTGTPKRVPLTWDAVATAIENAAGAYAGSAAADAPQVMVHPLGNVAGLAYATPPLAFGRRLVLLERFEPLGWAAAVRDHRPVRGTIPPAGVRMLLDSDVPRDWLASLDLVAVGGGKLDPELQQAFEERFGVPVLPAFGATEFGGVIANWTLDLHRRHGAEKRGSAGQASAGVALRIVDRETFAEVAAGTTGLLEAKVARIGPGWIRTNDLGLIDADGFLFLHGRADDAINRGGFKIVPEAIAQILRGHPAVADAAVVGVPDARLGAVPVAAVELAPGAAPIEAEALLAWLGDRVLAYQRPVAVRIVAALPRNASFKVAQPEVRALFAPAEPIRS